MVQKNQIVAFVLFCCLPTTVILSERHARKKKLERLENRKKIVITGDQELSLALGKHTKNMNFKEAILAKGYYVKEKDITMAIKCSQRALAVGGDQKNDHKLNQEIMRSTRFELAELFLGQKNYKEAEKYALEYIKLYPGADEAINAEFIAIQANFLSQLPSDREQEKTHKTIQLAQDFLDKHADHEYSSRAKDMLNQSYQTLIRSEMNIIMTQLNNYNYTKNPAALDAVNKRIEYMKEKYVAHAPLTQKKLTELEIEVAKAAGKTDLVKAKQDELARTSQNQIVLAQAPNERGFFDTITSVFAENNNEYFA